jgi:hypothetical protein
MPSRQPLPCVTRRRFLHAGLAATGLGLTGFGQRPLRASTAGVSKRAVGREELLRVVTRAIDTLIAAAEPHRGLFPAMADRTRGRLLLEEMPPVMEGLRDSDRSFRGCNLSHDLQLLETLYALADAGIRRDYSAAADRYLDRFAVHCAPRSVTGLLPWGEHAYWDLHKDDIGNAYVFTAFYRGKEATAAVPTHHQIKAIPRRLWDRLWSARPETVTNFAEGLEWHWSDESRLRFDRHAPITVKERNYHSIRYARMHNLPLSAASVGSDFPASCGLFIHDLVVAQSLKPSPVQEGLLRDYMEYWWPKRSSTGLLPISGSRPNLGVAMTMGYALALADAADEADRFSTGLAAELRRRAGTHLEGVLSVPQPFAAGGFVHQIEPDGKPFRAAALWTAPNRGRGESSSGQGLDLLRAYRFTKDPRFLEMAVRMGRLYQKEPVPTSGDVRAADFGQLIRLYLELDGATGDKLWLEEAVALAGKALELFFDQALPRAGLSRDHYEPQAGSSLLIQSLQLLAMRAA